MRPGDDRTEFYYQGRKPNLTLESCVGNPVIMLFQRTRIKQSSTEMRLNVVLQKFQFGKENFLIRFYL